MGNPEECPQEWGAWQPERLRYGAAKKNQRVADPKTRGSASGLGSDWETYATHEVIIRSDSPLWRLEIRHEFLPQVFLSGSGRGWRLSRTSGTGSRTEHSAAYLFTGTNHELHRRHRQRRSAAEDSSG